MDRIMEIKNKVRISEWSDMVRACRSNGLTVQQWCNSNGINIKTGLRKKLCKQYLTKFDKAKITGIGLI